MPDRDEKVRIALQLCDHDICACGEVNPRGEVIGFDLPADLPPDPRKEEERLKHNA